MKANVVHDMQLGGKRQRHWAEAEAAREQRCSTRAGDATARGL